MKAKARKSCPNCSRLQAKLNAQQAELEAQKRRLAALEATVARLQEQLAAARKDSSTSSKPPSSDIVKPPKPPPPEGQERRQHRRTTRTPQARTRCRSRPKPINGGSLDYRLDLCPWCGHGLEPTPAIVPRVIQQVDINDVPLEIQEHRSHPGWCPHCQKQFIGPAAHRHRTRRPGRAAADHRDRLPQGGLPRLVLHHPQVRPRCRPVDHLARATGQRSSPR